MRDGRRMSDGRMGRGETKLVAGSGDARLEQLQREAIECLNAFPDRVTELNGLAESYAPASIIESGESIGLLDTTRRITRSRSMSSTIREYELASTFDIDMDDGYTRRRSELCSIASYRSLASYDRNRKRHGIGKRKYNRSRGPKGSTTRPRPGPLGQLLVFVASKLAASTRAIVLTPSRYIVNRIIAMFFQRRKLKNALCGPSADRKSSVSTYVTAVGKDDTRVGSFANAMRPAAVKLIADTTTMKRWLQAIALTAGPPSTELVNATRTTETIDRWAYELFFHLKYLRVNRSRILDKVAAVQVSSGINDERIHINLWHRLVQLRDNYIILYETLHDEPKIHETMPPK